jgi:hypothetical protein
LSLPWSASSPTRHSVLAATWDRRKVCRGVGGGWPVSASSGRWGAGATGIVVGFDRSAACRRQGRRVDEALGATSAVRSACPPEWSHERCSSVSFESAMRSSRCCLPAPRSCSL